MAIDFEKLWENHPSNGGDETPCRNGSGVPAFDNQCAIRMGACLQASGVDLRGFHGARCWYGHRSGHILRAEELANWLRKQHNARQLGASFHEFRSYQEALSFMRWKRGVVFYKNFWGRNNTGDHIDLWNRAYATREFRTFLGALPFASSRSPYNQAQEVWFWRMG